MTVIDISRVEGYGTQVIVRSNQGYRDRGNVTPKTASVSEWARWEAAANLLKRDENIAGELVRVDFFGYEVQFSYKENKDE